MEIKYLGHSSFLIRTKTGKIITDPFDPKMVGLRFPKQEADIVTVSHHHQDHDYLAGIAGEPLVLDWPGEFEKQAIRVFGFSSFHDPEGGKERGEIVIYKIEAEGLNLLHCGDLGLIPPDQFIDSLGEINILMLPVGGFYTISPEEAVKLVQKIEPAIVLPMHFGSPALNQTNFGKLADLSVFLKLMGVSDQHPLDKLVVKKEDVSINEQSRVVTLRI